VGLFPLFLFFTFFLSVMGGADPIVVVYVWTLVWPVSTGTNIIQELSFSEFIALRQSS